MGELSQHLHDLTDARLTYTVVRRTDAGGLQIEIPPGPAGLSPMVHRATTLAWAYLEGVPGHPVFPFCVEQSLD